MALLLMMPGRDCAAFARHLRRHTADLDIRIWPETGDPAEVIFAVCWQHPPGSLSGLARLRAISSYGAGVDQLLRDLTIPEHITIARIIDPNLARELAEYLVAVVSAQRRQLLAYVVQQRRQMWQEQKIEQTATVGFLGLGEMGGQAARAFASLGYEVHGWSRSSKQIAGIRSHTGIDGLTQMLAAVDFVISALPLTRETENLIDTKFLRQMRRGACLVNVGRGEQIVDADLMAALDEGHLGAAWLDVFRSEPLSAQHPFWCHPRIHITPHIAGKTNPATVAAQVAENYRRLQQGLPLLNTIDRKQGY